MFTKAIMTSFLETILGKEARGVKRNILNYHIKLNLVYKLGRKIR